MKLSPAAGVVRTAVLAEPVDVTFTAADGTPQQYVLMLPADFDAAREHPLLLAFHGHGADRRQFVKDTRG